MITREGWSFGIITDGHQQERILKIINSIKSQNIPNFEVIIVGDNKKNYSFQNNLIKFINFKDFGKWQNFNNGETFPISIKKNLIINKSQYDKICFLHDYVMLDKNWYSGILKYENKKNWKILTNIIFNKDKTRVFDWVLYDHPVVYKKVAYLPIKNRINHYQYIPGYYWCAKKEVMNKYKLNEALKWGEKEDVEWSKRVRKVYKFSFNSFSSVSFLKYKYGPWSHDNNRFKKLVLRSYIIKLLFYLRILKNS